MKKIALLTTAMAGLFVLSGCSLIEKLTDPEKEYNLAEFKELLADRTFEAHPYSKCDATTHVKTESEEKTESFVYTWDAETKTWINAEGYNYYTEFLTSGEIRDDVRSLSGDYVQYYSFFAKKESYRIAIDFEDEKGKTKFEWTYNKYGLVTQVSLNVHDYVALTHSEGSISAAYSK